MSKLSRRTPLVRRTPLPRGTSQLRRTPMPRATRKASPAVDIPDQLRQLVYARDLNQCVRCGCWTIGAPRSVHHRQPRGMGGSPSAHTAANLILLCGTGCSGCHGWVETHRADARDAGWLVRSGEEPDSVPVLVAWLGLCLPGEDWTPLS